MSSREDFLTSVLKQNPNYEKVFNWVLDTLYATGKSLDDLNGITENELIELIIEMKPVSVKAITNFGTMFKIYAKYSNDEKLHQMVAGLDRKQIWSICKANNKNMKRFISHDEFESLCFNIEMMEEYNAEYYIALLRSIYEGIYNNDMSVLKNLRANDIHGDIVTLRNDDGNSFDMKISDKLADALIEMSDISVWKRSNGRGICNIKTEGIYPDSCFKVENRHDTPDGNYRFSYFKRLRKISSDYLDFSLKPFHLYLSGIMWRVQQRLEENGMNFLRAFQYDHRRGRDIDIIQEELKRCHYPYDFKSLCQLVKGYMNDFVEEENNL